jgi:hypothetical protein
MVPSGRQVGARPVTGDGDAMEARLAVELARILEAERRQVSWVRLGTECEAVDVARQSAEPTVLVVDYAETRTAVLQLMAEAAQLRRREDAGAAGPQ